MNNHPNICEEHDEMRNCFHGLMNFRYNENLHETLRSHSDSHLRSNVPKIKESSTPMT